ncbi:MAG: hypothetical protein IJB73_05395 [Firmicutes bacterium]|nr:hypothetical protein [Bacillota bacterium]
MTSREAKIRDFVKTYDIEVPQEKVAEEYNYMCLALKQQLHYQTMGSSGLMPWQVKEEVEQRQEELMEAAYYEIKYDLVMKDIIEKQEFEVTKEELEAEAAAMAQRQNTTVELIKSFFGEELSMLEKDVKIKKAEDWICSL